MRSAARSRDTKETKISVDLHLDRPGPADVTTGIRMLDHLLEQFAFHSNCGLRVRATSLDSLAHHIVEDVAIVLGETLAEALGDRANIERYACVTLPMDDALVRAAVDFGGRPYARTNIPIAAEHVEDLAAVLIPHFFSSFAFNARIGVHVDLLYGTDPHHSVEAAFKAVARACAAAWSETRSGIASTKGSYL